MSKSEYLLELTRKSIDQLTDDNVKLSAVVQTSARIARLRNDFGNLWWLEKEMIPVDDTRARNKVFTEIAPHYSKENFEKLKKEHVDRYLSERMVQYYNAETRKLENEEKICGLSVKEIENTIESIEKEIESLQQQNSKYLSEEQKFELQIGMKHTLRGYKSILGKIHHRVSYFLSHTEKQIIFGKTNSDIFEINRVFVDSRLRDVAPNVLDKFLSAIKRVNENFDAEAGNQALLSCRRILQSIADKVYPPKEKPQKGPDGKERVLTEEKYINRLWQFVYEKLKTRTKGKLLLAQTNDLGARIDGIYNLSSKGVHAEVDKYEINQCVIQTYLLIGDILRLSEKDSGLNITDNQERPDN